MSHARNKARKKVAVVLEPTKRKKVTVMVTPEPKKERKSL